MTPWTDLLGEVTRIASGESTVQPDPRDKRFDDPVWQSNPFYKTMLQSYLLWQRSLNTVVDESNLPKNEADRARLAVSLVTDAAAPTNTLLGNPAALRRLFETGGASAVDGARHMLEDLLSRGGMPSQVDMRAFKVGENLAVSPGAVVFRNDVLELIQYAPRHETVYSRPILCVPPQINKFYILDLAPGKSLVDYLTESGFTVFMISWRNPTPKQRDWTFATYVDAILEATDVAREITAQSAINIAGVCAGGMTLALLLGQLAARRDRRFSSATFMVTVLGSLADSQLGLFLNPRSVAASRVAAGARGVVEGQELARIFAWLRPNDLVWNYWVNNYLMGKDPPAFDVLYWNNDTTRLPARFHAELLDMALAEALPQRVDLSKVKLDTFVTAGVTDHITPWQGCYATTQLLGGKPTFALTNAGHIQSILNPPGNPKASCFIGKRYPSDPEKWRAAASQHSESWWDIWREWLARRSGERIQARGSLGSERYPAMDAAPGRYVLES
jgi:polyhydroxyalkanoate synthase